MKSTLSVLFILIGLPIYAQPSDGESISLSSIKISNVYHQAGKVGLEKSSHKPITPPVYDTLYQVSEALYIGERFNSTKQLLYQGVINANGDIIIPFKYRTLQLDHAFIIVGLQNQNLLKFGAYSLHGNELVKPKYKSLHALNNQYLAGQLDKNIIILNNTGVKLFAIEADSISLIENEFIKIYQRGKAGLQRLDNLLMVPTSYKDIKINKGDIYVQQLPKWNIISGYDTLTLNYEHIESWGTNFVATIGQKSWLINASNKPLSLIYDKIQPAQSSFAIVQTEGKWGVINNYGDMIIPPEYAKIISDEEVIYAQSSSNPEKWTLYDFYGFPKNKFRYDDIQTISEGRIAIKRNGKWGFLDRYGVEIIAPIFDKVSKFKNGYSIVTFYGEDGIINKQGKWVITPRQINIDEISNNRILAHHNAQAQVWSLNGELIYFTNNTLKVSPDGYIEYDSLGAMVRNISWNGTFRYDKVTDEFTMAGGAGLTVFRENNQYGFKDQKGRIVIANRYQAVKSFTNNMAAVMIHNKWGFIDLDERLVIQPIYDSVGYFQGNTCITKKNGAMGVVNIKGKPIIPNAYQKITKLSNGQFSVQKDNKWGILDNHGAIVIHPKYDQLKSANQWFYIIERNGKYGTMGNNGVNQIPMLYNYIDYDVATNSLIINTSYKNEWTFLKKAHPEK